MQKKDKIIDYLENKSRDIKRTILNVACKTNAHHLGSSLSIVDILSVLYFQIMNIDPEDLNNKNRDIFILSKGHAALGWYSALVCRGFFSMNELLDNFNNNGGLLGVHPDANSMAGIEISSGSLGHGLSVGAGIALSAKIDKLSNKAFVILGDGECNEGMVWEAAMFAGHHNLSNLVAIVDYNKWQAFGKTKEVMDLEPFADKWESFGWQTYEVDGHNINELIRAFGNTTENKGKPTVILAHTIKGKSIDFLENRLASHYYCINEEELNNILKKI